MIGIAASILLFANGRVAGVSGLVGGLVSPVRGEVRWRVVMLVGLLAGGLVASLLLPGTVTSSPRSLPVVALAGVLVGIGTRIGNGCTSGHGVCGISRLSPRSLVATLTFMATGALASLVGRMLWGQGS
jgi:uncharacterized membrane protein YedE/YeeE